MFQKLVYKLYVILYAQYQHLISGFCEQFDANQNEESETNIEEVRIQGDKDNQRPLYCMKRDICRMIFKLKCLFKVLGLRGTHTLFFVERGCQKSASFPMREGQ